MKKWWSIAAGIAALIVVGLVIYAWTPEIADTARIETQIAFDLRQQGVTDPFVNCPDGEILWEEGETFECEAGREGRGRTQALTVLMLEDTYEWALN